MSDQGINFLILLAMFFAFAAMMRGRRLQRQQRMLERTIAHLQSASASAPAALDRASSDQVDRLEARVRVLERIVTDRGHIASAELAAQIEGLRGPVPLEGELQ